MRNLLPLLLISSIAWADDVPAVPETTPVAAEPVAEPVAAPVTEPAAPVAPIVDTTTNTLAPGELPTAVAVSATADRAELQRIVTNLDKSMSAAQQAIDAAEDAIGLRSQAYKVARTETQTATLHVKAAQSALKAAKQAGQDISASSAPRNDLTAADSALAGKRKAEDLAAARLTEAKAVLAHAKAFYAQEAAKRAEASARLAEPVDEKTVLKLAGKRAKAEGSEAKARIKLTEASAKVATLAGP